MNIQALREAGFTAHAAARAQQRNVPPAIVELIERFGTCKRSSGADRMYFDKAARQRLIQHFGKQGQSPILRWLNVYVVIADDGAVVTVGHRTKHFRHN